MVNVHCQRLNINIQKCHHAAGLSLTFLGTIRTNHFLITVVIDSARSRHADQMEDQTSYRGPKVFRPHTASLHVYLSDCFFLICLCCSPPKLTAKLQGVTQSLDLPLNPQSADLQVVQCFRLERVVTDHS